MRTPLVAANWKMYKSPEEARRFLDAFAPLIGGTEGVDTVLCPPAVALPALLEAASGSRIHVGAQNMHFEEQGAFTGEISAGMLTGIGVTHVILGHSERRQFFCETDDTVHRKLVTALKHKLVPIVCVGENLDQRDCGETEACLCRHISGAFTGLSAAEAASAVVAYEPVWAIGTGKTATAHTAADAHAIIRRELASVLGQSTADGIRILYGGSVKPENARELLSQSEIDGALVGGASLDPASFSKIVSAAVRHE